MSPNPANKFVNIILSYDLKGESEIVFISEAGYVYHKESIVSISKNETYNIDISRIPTGKYLVTIKNGKTYTPPQKLIIL
ncbi:MAG: T9SS type A sorting domain-containing protein [Flavobacteriales bacterium]